MLATVVYANNPFDPASGREVKRITRHSRIDGLAPETELPFICVLNGRYILRDGWHQTVADGDVLAFVILPQGGGGGSNPLKIVLMVALAVAAPQIGLSISGSLGLAEGSFGALLVNAAIGLVGRVLINALIPEPRPPSSHQAQAFAAGSPTYNLASQGNRARIGEAIPVLYGQHLIYPDYAAEPYTEYAGNEQYLYQLFCVGQGEYTISNLKIEDTAISSFAEVSYEVVNPGSLVTLFPANVVTAAEVSGQELLTGITIGPFVVNPAATEANTIAIDIVAPRGLYYATDNGALSAVSAVFKTEARAVDDMGAPIGSWVTLGTETITAATATAQRRSYRYAVATGRYEVKVTRLDAKQTNSRYGHEIDWVSLRAYLPGAQDYGDVTMLAVRMRATNNLSSQSARRINCVAQRKLPIWNGSVWSAPTATRSIAWALADALRAEYGGNIQDARIDLAQLLALDAVWTARGDVFDGIFDQKQVLWESITSIARTGRAKPYVQGGVYHFTRDGQVSLPVALFNQRNIVKNSMHVEYLVPSDETADAVVVRYFDSVKLKPLEITAQLPGYSADNPVIVELFGVTSREQAWREGMYIAASNRYRRQAITFATDMEGFIPTFGDLIAIAHDRMNRSVSGDVLGYDSGTKTLTLSEPVTFVAGSHYFAFKKRDGSYSGPWLATAGVDSFHAVLDVGLDFTPDTGTDRERTSFSFGQGTTYQKLVRVVSVRPRSMTQVEIACINEDDAVHTADTGTVPPESVYWNLPSCPTRPVVNGLSVKLAGTPSNPQIAVEWLPAAGADHYYIESSYDSGSSWQRQGEVSTSNYLFSAQRGSVRVRVAAVGIARGEWAEWIGDPYAVPPPDVTSFIINTQPDGTRQFSMTMAAGIPADFAGYEIRYKSGTGSYTWDDLSPIHAGILPASPWESNQLDAGQYTFAVKGVDTSGNKSLNANFIVADLADQRLAGVIYSVLPRNYGWPGTKTNCYVESDTGDLVATDTSTWADLTTWSAWAQWPNNPAASITYQHSTIDLAAKITFTPLVTADGDGTITLTEQHSDDDITYSGWASVSAPITARYVRFRAVVAGSLPILRNMNIKLSGNALTEEVNDLATSTLTGSYRLGVGDIRIPFAKAFSTITQVQITLQNVGAGWSVELIDKDTTVGPRIKIYNNSNTLADATIDAYLRGF